MVIIDFLKKYYLHISVVILGFILRMVNIGYPKKFIMDEVYYVPDGYSIFKYGYEVKWIKEAVASSADKLLNFFIQSDYKPYDLIYTSTHPPFGKVLIGLGMIPFEHSDPMSWRITALIFGTGIIILGMVIAQQIFRNKAITLLAGLFIAIDGLMIAMSRVGMLDIFLTFFVMLGVIFAIKFLLDNKYLYIIFASVSLGLAMSIKWSALYFYIAIALVVIGCLVNKKSYKQLLNVSILSIFIFMISYLATWASWLINFKPNKNIFIYFLESHLSTLKFAASIEKPHNYKTSATEWFFVSRPTGFFVNSNGTTFADIIAMPNLLMWFGGIASLMVLIVWLLQKKMHIAVIILPAMVIAGWLPWLLVGNRTIFNFYTVAFAPYLYISLAAVIVIILKLSNITFVKIGILIYLILIILFAFVSYPTSVGLMIEKSNLIFKNYPALWINYMVELGLYDVSQIPQDIEMPWPNKELTDAK